MRPIHKTLVVFLSFGALANLVVTVTCVMAPNFDGFDFSRQGLRWPRAVPDDWPPPPLDQQAHVSFRSSYVLTTHSQAGFVYQQALSRFGGPLHVVECEYRLMPGDGGFSAIEHVADLGPIPQFLPAARWPIERRVPGRIIWSGLFGNIVVFAAALWLLFGLPLTVLRHSRRRRGRCPKCGYPVGKSPLCTECGQPVATGASLETKRERR